jgi:hypothetical protein
MEQKNVSSPIVTQYNVASGVKTSHEVNSEIVKTLAANSALDMARAYTSNIALEEIDYGG